MFLLPFLCNSLHFDGIVLLENLLNVEGGGGGGGEGQLWERLGVRTLPLYHSGRHPLFRALISRLRIHVRFLEFALHFFVEGVEISARPTHAVL